MASFRTISSSAVARTRFAAPPGRPIPQTLPRRSGVFAKTVGALVPRLTRKAFEKYGFSTSALLTDWATIAGTDLASFTEPDRLKWPRAVDQHDEVADGNEGRPGATLILRVDGPRSIEIQFQTRQIIDRINAYFGYRAVAEIRIVQAPLGVMKPAAQLPAAAALPPRSVAARPAPPAALDAIEDPALRAALERLHAGMARRSCGVAP
jgi:hypothetical protein